MKKIRFKTRFKRITFPNTIWIIICAIILLSVSITAILTVQAYQEPTITEESEIVLSYSGNSRYNYIVSLKNNTVYDNKTTQRPGEGIIFKNIVENITGYLTFSFQASQSMTMTGSYSTKAIIQTDLWSKSYNLIPTRNFEASDNRVSISDDFPIDFSFYDTILTTINQETGITAPNPILLLQTTITLSGNAGNHIIYETYTPQITMSLNQKTIEFSDILSYSQTGSKTETKEVFHPEVIEVRNSNLTMTFVFSMVLITFLLLIERKTDILTPLERELKRIEKKYGEFMVETDTAPNDPLAHHIELHSIDHIGMISEDLGKPIIHTKNKDNSHTFTVVDNNTIYRYVLSMTVSITKNVVICSNCQSEYAIEEDGNDPLIPTESICPYCGTAQEISNRQRDISIDTISSVLEQTKNKRE